MHLMRAACISDELHAKAWEMEPYVRVIRFDSYPTQGGYSIEKRNGRGKKRRIKANTRSEKQVKTEGVSYPVMPRKRGVIRSHRIRKKKEEKKRP